MTVPISEDRPVVIECHLFTMRKRLSVRCSYTVELKTCKYYNIFASNYVTYTNVNTYSDNQITKFLIACNEISQYYLAKISSSYLDHFEIERSSVSEQVRLLNF